MSKIIGIFSAKGGVGKTTTAINIASAFNQFGYSSLVVDTDITSPNVGLFLGNPANAISLNHVLENKIDINKAIYSHDSGINVIIGSLHPNKNKFINYDEIEMNIKKIIGKFDFIILDSSPGTYEETMKSFVSMDNVIIVTTPDMIAVTDALRTVTVAKQFNKNILGTVLTRVGNNEHEIRKENVEVMLGTQILASVPEDKNIPLSLKVNYPVILTHPESDSSIAYKKIAAKLLNSDYNIIN